MRITVPAKRKTVLVFSLIMIVLGSSSTEASEMEKIGIRRNGRYAHLYGKQSGQPFFVKGINYIRLRHGDHATFEVAAGRSPAYYDREQADSMLRMLSKNGYNTVRVFIIGRSSRNPGIGGDYEKTQGLYEPYTENVLDFLRLARTHGIYVLPTFGDGELPRNKYYRGLLPRNWSSSYERITEGRFVF